nr:unnamed protein product [Callosobruchus chinensis]
MRLIGDPALTCLLQPLSHRRAVGDLSLFYRYSNGCCSSEMTSIILLLSNPARCTRGTFSSPPPQCSHSLYIKNRTMRPPLYPQVSRAWNRLPGDVIVEPASVRLFKPRGDKLSLT